MSRVRIWLSVSILLLSYSQAMWAQATPNASVPPLVRFSGTLTDGNGTALTGIVGVTFFLYQNSQGGAPLWMETQNVQPDKAGRYSVMLGSTTSQGLPSELFVSGEARWMGVLPQGQAEQPRVLLLSVPYALKAADAATVGGLPPAAFVLATPPRSAAAAPSSSGLNINPNALALGGSGTTNYIPIWTNSTTLGNSLIFQTGGKVGIGNTHPAGTLDVSGGAFIRGALQLPTTGTATATQGFISQPVDALASAFNSSTRAAVNQHFRWQAEPVGNNTPTPSGKFNLLFASGNSNPAETGLSINSKGLITFAAGQQFSGTGTITGVTAGTDLTGGGTSGKVTLNLDVTKTDARYPQLKAANTFTGSQTVTGNVVASGTVSGGTGSFGLLAVSSNAQVANLNASLLGGLSAGSFAPAGSYATTTGANTFTKNQTIAGGSNGQTAIIGDMGCGLGGAGIGFFGIPSGCTNYGLLGFGSDTLINRPSGGTIRFRENNGADQMVITTGGYVGIGTFSPSATLEVDSPSSDAGKFVGAPSTSDSRNSGIIAYGGDDNGNTLFTHGGVGGLFWGGAGNNPLGASGDGIDASPGPANFSAFGYAGYFNGDVNVIGHLYAGIKDFKIDHPLDPANKYLYHSSVESSEMMNIYTGNVTTDTQGDAAIQLPEWFEALNGDFRYQLTVIGQFAQAIVASKIANNQFHIKTDKSNVEVSWQVTGVRQDVYAKAHPLQVEVGKSERERGFYIHPDLYGAPEEKGMEWARHPEMMKQMKERRQKTNEQQPKSNQTSK